MNDTPKKDEFQVPVNMFDSRPDRRHAGRNRRLFAGIHGAMSGAACERRLGRDRPEDWKANFDAMISGERILSAYPIDPAKPCEGFGANTLWIITESDRSATTFLLPDEY